MLHKRNIGVLENKQKRFTEHPPRKKNKFLEISHRSVRIYIVADICDSAKGGFEAAVNLDILQKKFSHQGQFRALEFILASTLSDHQKGSLISNFRANSPPVRQISMITPPGGKAIEI